MKCEHCEHTIAPDSPVWCGECHNERVFELFEEQEALIKAVRDSLPYPTAFVVEAVQDAGRDLQRLRAAVLAARQYVSCDVGVVLRTVENDYVKAVYEDEARELLAELDAALVATAPPLEGEVKP